MRILKVVEFYYPFQEKGGPILKVRALARALARRGHHVTVLTADWGLSKRSESGLAPQRCRWGWHAVEHGVEIIYLPSLAHYRALTLNPRVTRFCDAALSGFDLAHFYGLYDFLGPAVGFYCRHEPRPYVIEPMGMYRPIDRAILRKSVWHKSFGKAFCRGARKFVATAELERATLIEEGIAPDKIVVRYNGIDSDIADAATVAKGRFRQKWGIPSDEPIILFLSRLIPRKGADILIDAFGQACPESGRLVIAGPEGERGYLSYLRARAESSGVSRRVIFTGPLYNEEKATVFSAADVFALPSRFENFANVAAEAIACEVPVVVSDSCGIAPLVDGKAGLVIPLRTEALTRALQMMITDKKQYIRFKSGCREVANELRWENLAEQMETIYGQVLVNE